MSNIKLGELKVLGLLKIIKKPNIITFLFIWGYFDNYKRYFMV